MLLLAACGGGGDSGPAQNALTAFSLDGVAGTIDATNKTIAVVMPFGTDVRALVAGFSTTGAAVAVGVRPQVSGTTANDFTIPLAYTVFATNGSAVDYRMTFSVALNPAKALTAFALSATFSTTGQGVAVGGGWQHRRLHRGGSHRAESGKGDYRIQCRRCDGGH